MFPSPWHVTWAMVAPLVLAAASSPATADNSGGPGRAPNAVEAAAAGSAAVNRGGASLGDGPAAKIRRKSPPRVLFITAKDCPRCDEELARLRRSGGVFEKMQAGGWRIGEGPENQIQIVDREQEPELVQKLAPREFPVVACVEDGEVVRSFKSGCTTPLDAWTFGFLAKGVDERPPGAVPEAARVESTGSYRLRGNHWSVEGDWNPTRESVIEHLRSSAHTGQLEPQWQIEGWSYEELRSLHDDLHERYDMPKSPSRPKHSYSGGKGYR
jgi:hypothetical protein